VSEVGAYYLEAGEPPGVWFGAAADRLGVSGEVDPEVFVRLLDGVDPTGSFLLGRRFGERSARGFDVTFSAPKSVSLLAAVADESARAEVWAAHDAAVVAVLGWVQRNVQTRFPVHGEVCSVDVAGIAAGVFRQHVSRELDPQLHSHAVIAARVLAPDGRWLSMDARNLMGSQHTVTGLYQAALRAELTRRLGVAWLNPERGLADLAGVDRWVVEAFSTRSVQVSGRLDAKLNRFRDGLDREPTMRERRRLSREAVLDSRRSKSAAEPAATLRAGWRARLDRLGVPAR